MNVPGETNNTTASNTDGSIDNAVQRTNDDSVVSKRSAVFHKYFEDPYLRHFVKKLAKRSPLINRGYYLRMLVITDLIQQCIHHHQAASGGGASHAVAPVQVVSLGAGYDTLAMRLKEESQYANVHFYEVDFSSVMQNKSELVRAAPKGSFSEDLITEPARELVKLHGKHYHAIGVDLRDKEHDLVSCLMKASPDFSTSHPTVLYAECVMQYMPPSSAADLIKHIAESFPCAIFLAYDQVNPMDSFGGVMQSSLRARGSPLLGLAETPGSSAMLSRALESGMKEARFANFHALSQCYLTGAERERVEALQPFDETEEWCEMCEHYGITMASTSHEVGMPPHPAFMETEDETPADPSSSREADRVSVRAEKWSMGRFSFEGWGNGQAFAEELPLGDVIIVSFGGFSATRNHQRTNTVYVHSLRGGECKVTTASSSVEPPPPLVFHSLSRISRGVYVVFGGRTNPQDVTMDAYLLQLDLTQQSDELLKKSHLLAVWTKLVQVGRDAAGSEVPEARFRHAAVALEAETVLSTEAKQDGMLFVFGGRNAAGQFLNDAWTGTVSDGRIHWKRLALTGGVIPPPSCSSAIVNVPSSTAVLLSGGLIPGDICTDAVWRVNWSTGECCKISSTVFSRFSHTMCHVKVNGTTRVLVLGGSTCEPRVRHPSAMLLDAETGEVTNVLTLPRECPTWTRHCCISLGGEGVVLVLGGGFTCFSFGTFTAKPLLLHLGDTSSNWSGMKQPETSAVMSPQFSTYSSLLSAKRAAVEVQPFSKENFLSLVRQPTRPVVFRKVDMGRCVDMWSNPTYLKEAEGNTTVSVHVARGTSLLDFVQKNFSFRHVSFAALVDHCVATASAEKESDMTEEETWYLRSVAFNMKTERANLWKEFPNLGADFVLPQCVTEYIEPRMHQACLRLNAPPLQLWTHYDVMDNVLCQITGRKRVVLFPPSEYNNLYMSGSSSAVLNIDAPDLARFPRFVDASYHAMEVILEPGDMLFLPSLWFHHITTMEGSYSVSVNVFFERLPKEDYDKKDLYGNKDLPAAARLRKHILEKVQQLVSESSLERTSDGKVLAPEFVEFALRQAIQDLEEMSNNMALAQRGVGNGANIMST